MTSCCCARGTASDPTSRLTCVTRRCRCRRAFTSICTRRTRRGRVARLIGLGATEVQWDKRPPDADYVILADPEGNRFCVVDAG